MTIEKFSFRDANAADVGDLALILERADAQRDGHPVSSGIEDIHNVDYMRSKMDRIGARTIAALHEKNIVAFALSHPLIYTDEPTIETDTQHLSLLMVDPDYWGQHIASMLVDRTIQHSIETDKRKLTLWTNGEDNARALAFYAHKGFVLSGTVRTSDGRPQVHHQLTL